MGENVEAENSPRSASCEIQKGGKADGKEKQHLLEGLTGL